MGCTARIQQVQGRDGPQEKITKKRRAKRYRMSAADAERPRRVAERARTCATTNQPPPCAASAEAQKRAQRQPPWKLCPARLLVHPLLLQNKLALLVLLRFLVGLQLQTRVKTTAIERRERPRTARHNSSIKRNTHAKSMQHKADKKGDKSRYQSYARVVDPHNTSKPWMPKETRATQKSRKRHGRSHSNSRQTQAKEHTKSTQHTYFHPTTSSQTMHTTSATVCMPVKSIRSSCLPTATLTLQSEQERTRQVVDSNQQGERMQSNYEHTSESQGTPTHAERVLEQSSRQRRDAVPLLHDQSHPATAQK